MTVSYLNMGFDFNFEGDIRMQVSYFNVGFSFSFVGENQVASCKFPVNTMGHYQGWAFNHQNLL